MHKCYALVLSLAVVVGCAKEEQPTTGTSLLPTKEANVLPATGGTKLGGDPAPTTGVAPANTETGTSTAANAREPKGATTGSTGTAATPGQPVASSSPRPARPVMPAMPAADVKVEGVAEDLGSKVEIEGVCKISEDSISCWKVDGTSYEDLEKRIRASFDKQDNNYGYGSGPSVQIRLGKKNRVVVFKTTRPMSSSGGLTLQSVGDDRFGGSSYFSINLNDENMRTYDMNKPMVSYEVRSVSAEFNQTTTSARLMSFEPVRENPSMDFKIGASAPFEGRTYTVQSFGPAKKREGMGYMSGQEGKFEVVIRVSGPQNKISPSFQPANSSGERFAHVDKAGNPVTQEEYQAKVRTYSENMQKAMRAGNNRPQSDYPQYAQAYLQPIGGTPETMIFVTALNPKHIAKLKITGSRMKSIELTGIPLDPK
ncbi:MAG: hypothetical protein ABL949_12975 [Fimbriimonadaceae bacterium]